MGNGDVNIWTTVNGVKRPAVIKKVLYIPGLSTNLFSIAAVTDLGWKVTFTGSEVHFSSEQDNLIMNGERMGRTLYLLMIHPRSQQEKEEGQTSLALPPSVSPGLSLWHRRLAHVNYKTIIKMALNGIVEGLDLSKTTIPLEPCAGCAYGKHQRSPFPMGCIRATHAGQIIHSDLCYPMEKPTPSGYLYFALFISDYSGWHFVLLWHYFLLEIKI